MAVGDALCDPDEEPLIERLSDGDEEPEGEYVPPTVTTVALGERVCDTDEDGLDDTLADALPELLGDCVVQADVAPEGVAPCVVGIALELSVDDTD